jgi:hypothetical protein
VTAYQLAMLLTWHWLKAFVICIFVEDFYWLSLRQSPHHEEAILSVLGIEPRRLKELTKYVPSISTSQKTSVPVVVNMKLCVPVLRNDDNVSVVANCGMNNVVCLWYELRQNNDQGSLWTEPSIIKVDEYSKSIKLKRSLQRDEV